MFPVLCPMGHWCSIMQGMRRAFSSYWWVMGGLCRGSLPESWDVSVLFTRELVNLLSGLDFAKAYIPCLVGKATHFKDSWRRRRRKMRRWHWARQASYCMEQAPHFYTCSPSVKSGLAPARFQGCQRDELCSLCELSCCPCCEGSL